MWKKKQDIKSTLYSCPQGVLKVNFSRDTNQNIHCECTVYQRLCCCATKCTDVTRFVIIVQNKHRLGASVCRVKCKFTDFWNKRFRWGRPNGPGECVSVFACAGKRAVFPSIEGDGMKTTIIGKNINYSIIKLWNNYSINIVVNKFFLIKIRVFSYKNVQRGNQSLYK